MASNKLPITTERLTLRLAQAEDLNDLHSVYSDPRVMRYWSRPAHESLDITDKLLQGILKTYQTQPLYLAIALEDTLIGTAGIHQDAEIGYILGYDHWAKGYATEAVGGMLPYLFEATGADQITADADPNNQASVKVLEKLGFIQTGYEKNTFCVAGAWSDSVYFALNRPRPPA